MHTISLTLAVGNFVSIFREVLNACWTAWKTKSNGLILNIVPHPMAIGHCDISQLAWNCSGVVSHLILSLGKSDNILYF